MELKERWFTVYFVTVGRGGSAAKRTCCLLLPLCYYYTTLATTLLLYYCTFNYLDHIRSYLDHESGGGGGFN